MIEAVAIGVLAGAVCGLIPGLHPNTLIPVFLGLAAFFDPVFAAVVLVSAGVTNTFVSFVPSVLVGATEADESLSVLPGHRLFLQGRGYEAVKLTVIGGVVAGLLSILLAPVLFLVLPVLYSAAVPLIPFVLVAFLVRSVLSEPKVFSAVTVVLSGILGFIVLSEFPKTFLFPLLSGLFGLPVLLLSSVRKTEAPETVSFESDPVPGSRVLRCSASGIGAGIFSGLFPGLGVSQSAALASSVSGKGPKDFLITLGGINTVDIIYSLFALVLIGNPRSGIAVAVGELIDLGFDELVVLTMASLASIGAGALITLAVARRFLFWLRKVDYPRLSLSVFFLVLVLVLAATGPLGLAVALVSCSVGLIPNLTGARRTTAMACLMVPTALWYLG